MKSHLTIFFLVALIITSGYLGYDLYNTKLALNSTLNNLHSTSLNLDKANQDIIQKSSVIDSLKKEVSQLSGEIVGYQFEVAEKQQKIIESQNEISKLSQLTEEQKSKIDSLRSVLKDLDDTGNLISEYYHDTLILYDNSELYELFKPLWLQVADDPEDYSQLGIPFVYFRDESKKDEENIVLGQYSGLYDTIFIYNDASEVRVIYHEIAHMIYQRLFAENENNKEIWSNMYADLKQYNLLSSQYAYENELEGFAEEYSFYKTGLNPNQPEAVKDMFDQIDTSLR